MEYGKNAYNYEDRTDRQAEVCFFITLLRHRWPYAMLLNIATLRHRWLDAMLLNVAILRHRWPDAMLLIVVLRPNLMYM